MTRLWAKFSERFATLSGRERAMVLGAIVAVIYIAIDSVVLAPTAVRRLSVREQLSQAEREVRALSAQVDALAESKSVDPNAASRARLEELRKKIAAVEGEAKQQSSQLITAERMRSVLQRILAGRQGLELVELRTLPQSTLEQGEPLTGGAAKGSTQAAPIYKHGVQLTVRGRYLDLLAYLKDIESLPARLYWDGLDLTVIEPPTILMKVTIYTISLDKAWMQV